MVDQIEVDIVWCGVSTGSMCRESDRNAPSPSLDSDFRKRSETVSPGSKTELSLVVTKKDSLGFPDAFIAAPRESSFWYNWVLTLSAGADRIVMMCTYLGTVQMDKTFFDRQAHWFSNILPNESCASSKGEERDLVAIVQSEG